MRALADRAWGWLAAPRTTVTLVLLAASAFMLGRAAFNWSRVLWAQDTTLSRAPLPFGQRVAGLSGAAGGQWTVLVGAAARHDLCARLPEETRRRVRVLAVSGALARPVACTGGPESPGTDTLLVSDAAEFRGREFALLGPDQRVVYGALSVSHAGRIAGVMALADTP